MKKFIFKSMLFFAICFLYSNKNYLCQKNDEDLRAHFVFFYECKFNSRGFFTRMNLPEIETIYSELKKIIINKKNANINFDTLFSKYQIDNKLVASFQDAFLKNSDFNFYTDKAENYKITYNLICPIYFYIDKLKNLIATENIKLNKFF